MVLPCLSVGLPGPGSPPPAICPSAIPEALGAGACVAIDGVHTLGPVAALVGHAVVVVCLAELPAVARDTVTPGTQVERGLLPQRLPASCGGSPPPRSVTRVLPICQALLCSASLWSAAFLPPVKAHLLHVGARLVLRSQAEEHGVSHTAFGLDLPPSTRTHIWLGPSFVSGAEHPIVESFLWRNQRSESTKVTFPRSHRVIYLPVCHMLF
jgi:hypothetical protein